MFRSDYEMIRGESGDENDTSVRFRREFVRSSRMFGNLLPLRNKRNRENESKIPIIPPNTLFRYQEENVSSPESKILRSH